MVEALKNTIRSGLRRLGLIDDWVHGIIQYVNPRPDSCSAFPISPLKPFPLALHLYIILFGLFVIVHFIAAWRPLYFDVSRVVLYLMTSPRDAGWMLPPLKEFPISQTFTYAEQIIGNSKEQYALIRGKISKQIVKFEIIA